MKTKIKYIKVALPEKSKDNIKIDIIKINKCIY